MMCDPPDTKNPAPEEPRDTGSDGASEKKEASGSKVLDPASFVSSGGHPHSPGRSIMESVKNYATESPSSSVVTFMHYATPHTSYLQKTLHNKSADADEVVEHDPAKGGLRGTFTDRRMNYLRQQLHIK